ncbi:MAG: hypothetical protein H6721_16160 [Sandaracinus sp.]|nr:hypothetical protein [Sandaracinus sp.]MCB9633652.1 hypothetical protein [Sandaracinus sp.]
MRAQARLAMVVALGIVASLQTTAFFVRADACWFLRMPASQRPPCCGLANKTRFTREGGDCCKHLVLDESVPATTVTTNPPVALAPVAPVVFFVDVVTPRPSVESAPPQARGPPPRPFHPTSTTVLRV